MKVCDVTQFYSPVSGGVKRYLSEKQAFIEREDRDEHILIIPGEKNFCQKQGRGKIYTIQSPLLERKAGYRFLWNLRALKEILEKERPDLIESGDPYQVGWKIVKIAEDLNLKKVAFYHSHFPEANLSGIEKYIGKTFQDFVQDFNLPTLTIPVDALNRIIKGGNRDRREQQPAKWLDLSRWVNFLDKDRVK